jgi:5,6-dimethylbenzimidazole synthase
MPDGSAPIAVLCVGHVEQFYPAPMLEAEGWDKRRPLSAMTYEDTWGKSASAIGEAPPPI